MLLLFIDTETNGLNSNLDNILEIGAILGEYNPASGKVIVLSEFQSLILPRQELNDTSSRITGLTSDDFVIAPKLLTAQDNWIKWLETQIPNIDNTEIKIIGHSIIDFDIKFLNTEGWFLPPKHDLIDTMFLAKILIPQAQAINLEFLTKMFNLENIFKNQTNKLQAHRALFDTYCTLSLFQKILELLTIYKLPRQILEYLNKTYLKLNLNYLEYYQILDLDSIDKNGEDNNQITEKRIDLRGQIIADSLLKQIEIYNLSDLIPFLKLELPNIWQLCLCQILCIKFISSFNPTWKLQLHGRNIEYTVMSYLLGLSQSTKISKIDKTLKYTINPTLEDLLWQINQIAEDRVCLIDSYNLTSQFLKILQKEELNSLDNLLTSIQLWMSSYEFFGLSLQPFWQYHQFKYDYNKLTLIEDKISKKFTSLIDESNNLLQNLKQLKESNILTSNPIINYLTKQLTLELGPITNLEPKTNYNFHLIKDYIQIAKLQADFDINLSFKNLFENYPNSFIKTFLNKEDAFEYTNLLGINNEIINNHIEFLDLLEIQSPNNVLILKNPNYSNLIINQIDLTALNLILCGDNQSFKQCQNICFDPLNNIPYLIIGESGSKTKILSKITNGFKGIVILKQKDLGYITNQIDSKLINQIILINKPYLVISNYFKLKWENKFNINQSKVLDLYLQSTSNRASGWLLA